MRRKGGKWDSGRKMQPSEAVSSDKTIQFHSSNYYQSKTLYCIYCVLISPFNLRMRNGGSQDSGRKNATGGDSWLRQRRRTPLGESEIKPNLIRMNQTNFNFAPLCIHFTKYIFIWTNQTKQNQDVSTYPIPSISNWYYLILTQYHFCTNHCCAILTQLHHLVTHSCANWI